MEMNKFESFCNAFSVYCVNNGFSIIDTSSLHEESLNDSGNKFLYNGSELEIFPMDEFVKNVYRAQYGTEDFNNRPNSVDCFVVNKDNKWFFIEFKDSEVSSTNTNNVKKAYSNVLLIIDVLYNTRKNYSYDIDFNYENPIEFFRTNSEHIIVCSEEKNPKIARDINLLKLSGQEQKVHRKINERLSRYLFQDSYICTEKVFEKQFVKQFEY